MYTDSINQFNGMSVVSGLSNVCICGDAIGDPKEIIIPNGFNPLTDNYIAIKAVFLNGHNAVNDSTYLTVKCKYANGDYVQDGADVVQIPIMANKDGSLINIPIHTMDVSGTTTYKVLQANTELEMYYDPNANGGNGAFVVIGNPIVLSANDSNSSYTVYANGFHEEWGTILIGTNGNFWQTVNFQIYYTQTPFVTDTLFVNSQSDVEQYERNQHQLYAINTGSFSLYANHGKTVYSNWKAKGY